VGLANAHVESDLPSTLTQQSQQFAGPYNARGVGFTENLGLVLNAGTEEVPVEVGLLTATAVRGEAVGVCVNGTPRYSAQSEIIDLRVADTDVGLNDPLTDLIGTISDALAPIASVVTIEQNVVNVTADGATVDALRVTALGLTDEPLLDLVVGHAEVGGLVCAAANVPECSDGADNDGDGGIDAQDPGCLTPDGVFDPNDDDERNECTDGVDNDGDGRIDFGNDPGCSSPQDDDERDGGGGRQLARTGGTSSTAPIAFGLMALAIGAMAVRRRSLA
ncbi:MAG: LPXTG cell wall anchor domain-containing protein, partial [Acidimicrobiales bacterium]